MLCYGFHAYKNHNNLHYIPPQYSIQWNQWCVSRLKENNNKRGSFAHQRTRDDDDVLQLASAPSTCLYRPTILSAVLGCTRTTVSDEEENTWNHCSFPVTHSKHNHPSWFLVHPFAKSLFGRVRTCTCDCTFCQITIEIQWFFLFLIMSDKGSIDIENIESEERLTTKLHKNGFGMNNIII